ncbi:MAG: hypothetical protein QOH06_2764 [Acidobacteriota bacterium]|nr:hypothetical protein [Acidobacteriota bacterium]
MHPHNEKDGILLTPTKSISPLYRCWFSDIVNQIGSMETQPLFAVKNMAKLNYLVSAVMHGNADA